MKTRTLAAALLIALSPVALGAPRAFAQAGAEDPTIKAARARFQEGVEFFDKGQYENARAAFLQAYALRKHPAVLLNLAQSSLRSGHALEAAKYFQQYLRESTSLSAQQRSDAEKGLAEAHTKVGRVEVSAPSGAEISLDGERIGNAPLTETIDVDPGTHTVKSRASDGNIEQKSVSVTAGQLVTARFGASSTTTPPPVVPTPPVTGATPETPETPPPDTTVTPPAPDKKVTPSNTNPLSPPKTMTPVYVGGALAVVGFGGAIAFAIAKSSAQSSANTIALAIATDAKKHNIPTNGLCNNTSQFTQYRNACASLADDNSKVDTDAVIANVALVVGIVGAATAVGWYLFAPKRDAAPAPTQGQLVVTPMLGARVGGLSLSGEF